MQQFRSGQDMAFHWMTQIQFLPCLRPMLKEQCEILNEHDRSAEWRKYLFLICLHKF